MRCWEGSASPLGRWGGPGCSCVGKVIFTQDSPLSWVSPTGFSRTPPTGMVESHTGQAHIMAKVQSWPVKEREHERLSTKHTSACWAAVLLGCSFSLPSLSPPHSLSHTHTAPSAGGWPPFWPQKPQASVGCGHTSRLVLGPLEGIADVWSVCLSQGFGYEGWPLPTRRMQGQHTMSRHRVLSLSLGSLPRLTLSVNPRCPQGQQQGLSQKAWVGAPAGVPEQGPEAGGAFPDGAVLKAMCQSARPTLSSPPPISYMF